MIRFILEERKIPTKSCTNRRKISEKKGGELGRTEDSTHGEETKFKSSVTPKFALQKKELEKKGIFQPTLRGV